MATDVKYSIILYSTGDPIVLSKCLNRLVRSVNSRRTEIIVVTDPNSKAPINELSNFYTTSESVTTIISVLLELTERTSLFKHLDNTIGSPVE